MRRTLTVGLLVPILIAASIDEGGRGIVCGGTGRADLGSASFRALLDTVAAGWNLNRAELAASCFTERALYLDPPNRQLYRGRAALRDFFAASIAPARPDRMRWHATAFDSVRQIGFGEYTYRGRQNYHGIAVLHLEAGLIRSWREYQYGSALSWEEFVQPGQ
jgi:hypothetical protein